MGGKKLFLAEQNEEIVQRYFEDRGWSAVKLDRRGRSGHEEAADWRICNPNSGYCFLCEVKTISSVHADIPYGPVEGYMLHKREKEIARLEELKRARLDTRLLVTPDHYRFLHDDEEELRRKYQHRRRNTEVWFREFVERLESDLSQSRIRNLPYRMALHRDDCYSPNKKEFESFSRWLEMELLGIHRGKPTIGWNVLRKGAGSSGWYCAFYPIHKAQHETDVDRRIQVMVIGPTRGANLEVQGYCYGTLNLDAITENVRKGSSQLESSASKEQNKRIPRVLVLSFETGIAELALQWEELIEPHLAWLLEQYPNLSVLAVLEMVPDGSPPPQEEGLSAWLDFVRQARYVPRFMVYHNACLRGVEPLDQQVFNDNRSVQFRYISENWQSW